jgi:hypothetical protein
MADCNSSIVQPVRAMTTGLAMGVPAARNRSASCEGQRSVSRTPSPMV